MKFKRSSLLLASILVSSLIVTYIGILVAQPDLLRLDVVVLELTLPPDLREKAYIYVSLMYPEGLKQVSRTVIDPENMPMEKVILNLRDLRKAWERERERRGIFAEPLIVVTGFTRSGKVFAQGIEVFWEELPKSVSVVLRPLRGVNVTRKQVTTAEVALTGVEPEPLDGCWIVRTFVDSYEWTAPAVIVRVAPDHATWGTVDYAYFINRQVGFRVSLFIESEWTSVGFFRVNKNSRGSHAGEFPPGQEYYIWMNFRYRYEKWHVYGRCDLTWINYYEEYVYVKDFYPETIVGGPTPPPGARLPPTDTWIYEGRYYASSPYIPYYRKSLFDLGSTTFAIDALRFIELLSLLGKISSQAAAAAGAIGLVVSVNFVYNNMHAFYFFIRLYSNPGTAHVVIRAQTEDYQTVPVLYFVSQYSTRLFPS